MTAFLRIVCLACAAVLPSVVSADEPADPAETPAQSIVVRTTDLGERLIADNPTLVDELLKGVIDGSEKSGSYDQYALTIYTLGTPAVEKLMPHLESDDAKRRDAASRVLILLMSRDDFPLESVVPRLVKLTEFDDEARAETARAMLSYSILLTQPEQRRNMQREIQRRLQGDD